MAGRTLYSVLFWQGPLPVGVTNIITCPPDTRLILRDIDAIVGVVSSAGLTAFGELVANEYFTSVVFPTGAVYEAAQWRGRQVLMPGQTLIADSNVPYIFARISGYSLTE